MYILFLCTVSVFNNYMCVVCILLITAMAWVKLNSCVLSFSLSLSLSLSHVRIVAIQRWKWTTFHGLCMKWGHTLHLFTTVSRAVSPCMGAAMIFLARLSSFGLYWVVSHFLARPVERKCYTQLNRKTRLDRCSRQLFIRGHGSGIV